MSKGKSPKNDSPTSEETRNKTPEEAAKQTEFDVSSKIKFLKHQLNGRKSDPLFGLPDHIREVVDKRLKNRYHGLPKNVSAFCETTKLVGVEAELSQISRATLNGRKDLLNEAKGLIAEIKAANANNEEAQKLKLRKERDEAEKQLTNLGAKYTELQLEMEVMKREFKSQESELKHKIRQQAVRKPGSKKEKNVTPLRPDNV